MGTTRARDCQCSQLTLAPMSLQLTLPLNLLVLLRDGANRFCETLLYPSHALGYGAVSYELLKNEISFPGAAGIYTSANCLVVSEVLG